MNRRIRSRLNFRGTPFDPCRSLPQLPTSPFWSPSEQSPPGPFRTALSRPGLPGLVIMPANETYILVCGCATGNHPHTLSLMSAAILSTRTSGHAASWILRFIGAQRVRRFWAHGRQLGSNPQARVSDITVVKSPLRQQCDRECNRLWLLKNSLPTNPQKLDRVRMPYKRFSLVGYTFLSPQFVAVLRKSDFFNTHTCFRQRSQHFVSIGSEF
jgi:hypothetical protein